MSTQSMSYSFSKRWFEKDVKTNWDRIIPIINPKKILEVGSFEGAATCYLIEKLGHNPLEVHCIDLWDASDDIAQGEEATIERRFDHNLGVALRKVNYRTTLHKHKAKSHLVLAKMVADGVNDVDFIYVDASHYSVDVLTDAVLAFKLLRPGGTLIFDDYLWSGNENVVYYPKIAIDAFTTIFSRHLHLIPAPISQICVVKNESFGLG